MSNLLHWVLTRLRERSTWLGLISLLAGFGVALQPDQSEAIIAAGTALAGLVAIFTPDSDE